MAHAYKTFSSTGVKAVQRDISIGGTRHSVFSDDQYLAQMPEAFEPEMTAVFKALITPDMVVADVGANIGMTALLFAQLARKTFAFEPAPSTFALLRNNLDRNQITNVQAHNLGMGDRCEQQTITFAPSNRSGGFVSETLKLSAGHITETIEIDTLDRFFHNQTDQPDFIKLDVEGFEPRVLRGARALLAARHPTVVLELNHFCLNIMHRVSVPDFLDQLTALFPFLFALERDNSGMADLHDPDQRYRVMNLHVTKFRFPNIVASFDPQLEPRLKTVIHPT